MAIMHGGYKIPVHLLQPPYHDNYKSWYDTYGRHGSRNHIFFIFLFDYGAKMNSYKL
jgi:hypothetical protein